MQVARRFLGSAVPILAALVVLGVFVQVYLAASTLFGAADALDAHRDVGFIVHTIEMLILVFALIAWRSRRHVLLAVTLAVVGTGQVALSEADEWAGGLHGLFALVVLVLATLIAHELRPHGVRSDAGAPPSA